MNSGWLWSGLDFGQWLLAVAGQTLIGFLLIAIILSPALGWLKNALNPLTPGGAGSRVVAGREVHEILDEAVKRATPA